MSGHRYPPPPDARFPRDRSPSRSTFSDIHPSRAALVTQRPEPRGPNSPDFVGDAPRGPKALVDQTRPPPAPPLRGRRFSRGDPRSDLRDRDPSPPRDQSWRDRDFDRRDAASPAYDRPSTSDFRETRPGSSLRDPESARGRRGGRDVPFTPQSRFGEPRPPAVYHPTRGDDPPARGRGQHDWPARGRGRRPFAEDRAPFARGSSRSPPRGYRWDRDGSREDRPSDRFDDSRIERRESEKALERDERAREAERYRREQFGPSSASSRNGAQSPAPSTPRGHQPPPGQPLSLGRPNIGNDREQLPTSRRVSSSNSALGPRGDTRRDMLRDAPQKRDDDPTLSRPSSPPRAPEVPAFGSINHKANDQPWNVWKAPETKQPPPLPQQTRPPSLPSPTHKAPPVAPKADIERVAPKAPRADRPLPTGSITDKVLGQATTPTGSSFLGGAADPPDLQRQDQPGALLRSPPTGPRQLTAPPSGPRAAVKVEGQNRAARMLGNHNVASPPTSPGFAPPTGPRAAATIGIPLGTSASIPTGPKATRTGQVQQASQGVPTGPAGTTSWQRSRADAANVLGRPSGITPAKRDADGTEKTLGTTRIESDAVKRTDSEAYKHTGSAEGRTTRDWGAAHQQDALPVIHSTNEVHSSTLKRTAKGPGNLQQDSDMTDAWDDDDAMNLDETDIAQNELKFNKEKAELEYRKVDLSSRRLRGSTPLEQLTLLNRLALEDPSVFFDAPKPKPRNLAALASREELTQDDTETTNEYPADYETPCSVEPLPRLSPSPIGTPEVESLKFLQHTPLTPLSDWTSFQDNLKHQDANQEQVILQIRKNFGKQAAEEEELQAEYEELYREWRRYTFQLDKQREKMESDRQDAAEVMLGPAQTEISPIVATSESRGRRNFATQYEFEKVLEMSREEANRDAQAKREREAIKAKPDYDREAVVPDLLPRDDHTACLYVDTTGLREEASMIRIWELLPPEDDFSLEEHQTLLQNFKEFPKKFGKIAQALPNRTYKDCINHYYSTKWDGQYKQRDKWGRKRNVRGPKPRNQAKPRANALLSNLEDARPELYDGEEANAALPVAMTDSGRPRRAAAPTFKDTSDQSSATTPARRNAKTDAVERSTEKPKRQRTQGEKKVRRPKTQTAARPQSMSPEKEGLGQAISGPDYVLDAARTDLASDEAQLYHRQGSAMFNRPDRHTLYTTEGLGQASLMGAEAGKLQPVRSANSTSSYWSVQDVNAFPRLLQHYGTDWHTIAREMGTKSHTMVKNYYGRLKVHQPELEEAATRANARRERGENIGPPPDLSTLPPTRRRNEGYQPVAPRTLAPSIDAIDVEEESLPATTAQQAPQPNAFATTFDRQPRPPPSTSSHLRSSSFGHHTSTSFNQNPPPTSRRPAYGLNPGTADEDLYHDSGVSERRAILGPGQMFSSSEASELQGSRTRDSVQVPQTMTSRELWDRPIIQDVYHPPSFHRQSSAHGDSVYGKESARQGAAQTSYGAISGRSSGHERRESDEKWYESQSHRPESPRQSYYVTEQRPRSTFQYDHVRQAPPGPPRDEARSSSQTSRSFDNATAQTKTIPRKSNIMDILNSDEPKESKAAPPSQSRPFVVAPQSIDRAGTPSQYLPITNQTSGPYQAGFQMPTSRSTSQSERADPFNPLGRQIRREHRTERLDGDHMDSEYRSVGDYGRSQEPRREREAMPPTLHASNFRMDWPPPSTAATSSHHATFAPHTASQPQEDRLRFGISSMRTHGDPHDVPSTTSSSYATRPSAQPLMVRQIPSPPQARLSYAPPETRPTDGGLARLQGQQGPPASHLHPAQHGNYLGSQGLARGPSPSFGSRSAAHRAGEEALDNPRERRGDAKSDMFGSDYEWRLVKERNERESAVLREQQSTVYGPRREEWEDR